MMIDADWTRILKDNAGNILVQRDQMFPVSHVIRVPVRRSRAPVSYCSDKLPGEVPSAWFDRKFTLVKVEQDFRVAYYIEESWWEDDK